MSLALHKASRMIRVPDPRLDFSEQGVQVISDSATGLIYQKYTSAPPTGGLVVFNTFQQPTQAISTKMFVKTTFEVTLDSGTDDISPFAPNGAPRQFPLLSVAQNARIQINGASNDIYPNQLIHALMRYNNTLSELGRDLSTCPSFPDMYQRYGNATSGGGGWWNPFKTAVPTVTTGYGTSLGATQSIGESSFSMEARGGWVPLKIVYGANLRNAVVTFESVEPVCLSPLVWGHDSHKSLIGVNTLNLTFNLGDLNRVWCANNDKPVGTPHNYLVSDAKIIGNCELYTVLMTPKMIDKIDPVQIYPWHQIFPYQQNTEFPARAAATNTLTTIPVSYNAIQLSGVPKRIYIYAKRSDETVYTTDTFAQISELNVQFDTVTGIFGGASMQQLYQVCVENGYNGSFMDWAYYSGSIMCIDCEKDLPLGELLSVGSSKNITFSYSLKLTDIDDPYGVVEKRNYKVYTMVVYEGIFSIDQFNVPLFQLNTVTPQDIINAHEIQRLPYHAIKGFASGGSFGSQLAHLGSFARKLGRRAIGAYESLPDTTKSSIGNIVKDAATLVSPALSKAIEDFGPIAYDRAKALVGLGYSEDQIYELLAGAGMKKKKASKVSGGKKLTKAQLQKLAMG